MSTHIALLRGVNLTGHKKVMMAELRAMVDDLGLGGSQTVLQSGNVVFRGGRKSSAALELLLEVETARRLGVETEFHVRTAPEWASVVASNPFPGEAQSDPGHLVVVAFKSAVTAKSVSALQALITGPEIIRGAGRQVYITYPDGIGASRLTTALIDRTLGARGTARNWNTVLKLAALTSA
jgi:uncharacterized protein (DUF1697 family)